MDVSRGEPTIHELPKSWQTEDMMTRGERGIRRLERVAWLLVVALALTVTLAVTSAAAQTVCGQRAGIIEQLKSEWQEQLITRSTSSNLLVEIYANPSKGSWTLLVTDEQSISCVKAAGKNFEFFPPVIGDNL